MDEQPRALTPEDVQRKQFRVVMRGYHEGEVDDFLDEVTEELARLHVENKRLREELEFSRTSRLEVGEAREADALLEEAREEAERILERAREEARALLEEARARAFERPEPEAAEPGPSAPGPADLGTAGDALRVFLARERAFLQNLANLIQSHAEGIKQDVRRLRQEGGSAPAPPAAESAPPAPAPPPGQSAPTAEAGGGGPSGGAGPEEVPEGSRSQEVLDLTSAEEEAAGAVPPDSGGPAEPEAGGEGWSGVAPGAHPPPSGVAPGGESARWSPDPGRDAVGPTPEPPRDSDGRERSLRELFWGEQ